MDNSNWRPDAPGGESVMETGNWRAQLQPDSRQRIINKIMDTLKRHLPCSGPEGLQELKKIADRFEEKIFTSAANQSDYLRKISLKMLTMENKSQSNFPNSLQSNPAATSTNSVTNSMQSQVPSQGQNIPISLPANQSQSRQQMLSANIQNDMASTGAQSSSALTSATPSVSGLPPSRISNLSVQNSNMQSVPNISQNVMGNSMGQGVPYNSSSNPQGQIQGRPQVVPQQQQQSQQHYLYQQRLQKQFLKQKLQAGNIPVQSHIQRQQQGMLQPTQLQSSQQSVGQSSSVMQPSTMQSTHVSGIQQNPQSTLQQSTQSMLQQHHQSALRQQQQQQQQQTSLSQHQPLMGQQSSAGNMQQNQLIGQQSNAGNILQQQQQQQQQRFMGQQNSLSNLRQHSQPLMDQQTSISNVHQQIGPQGNFSGMQQQQELLGSQPSNSSMQTNQQSVPLQQSKIPVKQQSQSASRLLPSQGQPSQQQQLMSHIQSQPAQLQQQMGLQQQKNLLQKNMQERFQQQNVIDQQKQQLYQPQRTLPDTPSSSIDSAVHVKQESGCDWQEEISQKIKAMKEAYLPELRDVHQKLTTKLQQHESLQPPPRTEQLEKIKKLKTALEQTMAFLQAPKHNILPGYKDKLGSYENQIVNLINSTKLRKPVQQGQHSAAQMMQQTPQPQSQVAQVLSRENQMNPPLEPLQGSVPAMQQSNMVNLQQNSQNNMASFQQISMSTMPAAQQNVMNSMKPSGLDSGQGATLNSLQQVAMGSLQQNPVSSQPANINNVSSQSVGNVLPSNINPLHSNSNMLQHQHLKQIQQRHMHMQHQLMQKQQVMQQQQLHQQAKQQLPPQMQTQQMSQINQMNDINEMKLRQGMGIKPGVFQLPSAGQRPGYQQLKPGLSFPVSSPQLLQVSQITQHSSPQIDQQNVLSSMSKMGTPLQSANSPFVVPSPSTPMAPSPMPGDAEKTGSAVHSHSNMGNVGHQSATATSVPAPSPTIGTPGISASPLLAECTSSDGTQGNGSTDGSRKPAVMERPIDRLIKAVSSMCPEALAASIIDIDSVVEMVDTIAGSTPGSGSRAAVGEDLVAMTKCRLQARNFMTEDGLIGMKRMRRYTSAMPLNAASSGGSVGDNFKQSEMPDISSTASSSIKRPRIEANRSLLEEIREINKQLIDTVVDISDEEIDLTAEEAAEKGDGTIVKCSFNAVALSPDLKSQYESAQLSQIKPLRLVVPSNYPKSSPVLLDKLPAEVSKEYENLSVKAKSRFGASLRTLSQPMSLKEIARTWDVCARDVISEYAQQMGGGSFTSRYGTWENCLSAA